jgi:hypothetical protein
VNKEDRMESGGWWSIFFSELVFSPVERGNVW